MGKRKKIVNNKFYMKSKIINSLLVRHALLSIFVILLWIILGFEIFHSDLELFTFLAYFIIYLLAFLPLILAVYISYLLIIKKSLFNKIITPLIILLGAILVPLFLYWKVMSNTTENPNWGLVMIYLVCLSNLFLLVLNEILFFINMKKSK